MNVRRYTQDCVGQVAYRIYSNKRRAALINTFPNAKCSAYSRAALIRGQCLLKNWTRQRSLSRSLKSFLEENAENRLLTQVTGKRKRKREIGLVVPAKFTAFTT